MAERKYLIGFEILKELFAKILLKLEALSVVLIDSNKEEVNINSV